MNIKIVEFLKGPFVDLAVDEDNGIKLIGIPFDHGGSGHTRYYALAEHEFERLLADESEVDQFVAHGSQYIGGNPLYFSDFILDNKA